MKGLMKPADAEPCFESKTVKKQVKWLNKILGVISLVMLLAVLVLIFVDIAKLVPLLLSDGSAALEIVLNILILLELVLILKFYLEHLHLPVSRIVEVGIIAVVKEVIFHLSIYQNGKLYGVAAILLVMGCIYLVDKWLDPASA